MPIANPAIASVMNVIVSIDTTNMNAVTCSR